MASRASFAPGVVAETTSGRRSARCRCSGSWIDLLARLPSLPTRSTSDVLSVRTQLQLRDSAGFAPDFPASSRWSVGNTVLVSKALAKASFASEKRGLRHGCGIHVSTRSPATRRCAQRSEPIRFGRRSQFRRGAAPRTPRRSAAARVWQHLGRGTRRISGAARPARTRSGTSRGRQSGGRRSASAVSAAHGRWSAPPEASLC